MVAAGAIALLAASPAQAQGNANPGILPIASHGHGQAYGEWIGEYWQWVLGTPADQNPLLDETVQFCGVGQDGSVWFIPGTLGWSVERSCTVPPGKTLFVPVGVGAGAHAKGVPIRTIWSKNMYTRLSYADRLGEVQASALLLAGRHDPEAPLPCSEELLQGIPDASVVVFEQSGHFPFIEEASLFAQTVNAFLNE